MREAIGRTVRLRGTKAAAPMGGWRRFAISSFSRRRTWSACYRRRGRATHASPDGRSEAGPNGHSLQPVRAEAIQLLSFARLRARSDDAVAGVLFRREPGLSYHSDSTTFRYVSVRPRRGWRH